MSRGPIFKLLKTHGQLVVFSDKACFLVDEKAPNFRNPTQADW